MTKFQQAVLTLLALIACIIFGGLGLAFSFLQTPVVASSSAAVAESTATLAPTATSTPTAILRPTAIPTPDEFKITQHSLGSLHAMQIVLLSKGWDFLGNAPYEDMMVYIYEGDHVTISIFGNDQDQLKKIVIMGDEFANFDPVVAVAYMYDIRYNGNFRDAVVDAWYDSYPGEIAFLPLATNYVAMGIEKKFDNGYSIGFVLDEY